MMERLTFNVRPISRGGGVVVAGRTVPVGMKTRSRLARVRKRLAATRERYEWDYLWMLAFTALLFFRPQDHLPALESLHLAELAAIAGLTAMAVRRLNAGQTLARINVEVMAVAAIGGIIVITIPFSIWPTGSLTVFTEIYVKIILIFALMMSTITTPRRLQQMTWLMIIASGYIALRGVLDYASGENLVEGDRLAGAVGGMFKNPNDLALNLVTFLAPTLFVVIQEGRTGRRLLAAAIAAVMVVATVFTKSRSGFLGLVAMSAVVAYYTMRIKPGFVFAVVLAGVLALPAMPASFWNRMDSIVNAEEDITGSRAARIRLFTQAIAVFSENPITGVGAGQFQNYNGPDVIEKWRVTHNVWLQVAAELGVFGLLTFAFLVARAYMSSFATLQLLRGARRRRYLTNGRGWTERHATEGRLSSAWRRFAPTQSAADDVDSAGRLSSLSDEDQRILEINAKSMIAGLVGWTICAFFASVAFNWTFYYVLALAVSGREIATSRGLAPARETNVLGTAEAVRVHA